MSFTGWASRRKPIGEKKRVAVQTEQGYYPAWEQLLRLHKLDWWHNYNAQRSQPGWPDYTVFGDGWHAWVEIKARNPITNRAGKVSPDQLRYKETIEKGGGEWLLFTLPDDWDAVDDWLCSKTGLEIRGRRLS